MTKYIDGLVQGRRNFSVLAMELRLSGTNPSTYGSGHETVAALLPGFAINCQNQVTRQSQFRNLTHIEGELLGYQTNLSLHTLVITPITMHEIIKPPAPPWPCVIPKFPKSLKKNSPI